MTATRQRKSDLGHRTMSVAAADELRRRILEGEFAEGHQLRQDALSEEFGISRIPIREALLQLEAEGLVTIAPHRGAIVSKLSIADIEELFELRATLEPMLLRRSAPHLTAQDYAELDTILGEYRVQFSSNNVSRWGELNTALHMRLYRHASRPRASAFVLTLLQLSDRYARMQLSFTDGRARAEEEHAVIVNLCRDGKIDAASAALLEHIRHVGLTLVRFLRLGQRK